MTSDLVNGVGFRAGAHRLFYEKSECPDTGATYLEWGSGWPDIFYDVELISDGNGGYAPWVATSFQNPREMLSRIDADGNCHEIEPSQPGLYSPAEQLTDEFGALVEDIDDLYPPPLRIEVE